MTYAKTKAAALTVATGVMTFGVNQLVAGNTTTGAVAVGIGLGTFGVYQLAEEMGHEQAANDALAALGTDTLIELSKYSAGEIDDQLDDGRK